MVAQEAASLAAPDHSASLDPAMIAALYMASDVSAASEVTQAQPPTTAHGYPKEVRRRLRRGRILAAIGSGMVLGAAAGVLAAGRNGSCYSQGEYEPYDRTAPRAAGAVLGGLGLSLALTGAVLMLSVPRETRRALPARAWLSGALFGPTAVTFLATTLSTVPEQTKCWW